jgi:threonine dehydrogenase-like Zn-dependent dehydrogenase
MKALVKSGPTVALCDVPVPAVAAEEVRVRVAVAGVCRTDLYVARGQIDSADPVILGHEFAGTIDAVGRDVQKWRPGQRVAVRPVLGCKRCPVCEGREEINCPNRTMLGVDHDGAFAEFVCVPAASAFPIPDPLPLDWRAAAYAEPVAAALAVCASHPVLGADGRILILGRNRFALLLERLLPHFARSEVAVCDPAMGDPEPPTDSFAVVVETGLSADTIPHMIRAARFKGTLIFKSRQPAPVCFDMLPALIKQLTFKAVNYGPFDLAFGLVAGRQLDLDGLLGPVYPLEAFAEVFDLAESSESAKLFFDPSGEHVRDRR